MRQPNSITTRTADELATTLGLKPEDGLEFDVRRRLSEKIAEVVTGLRLTREQGAASLDPGGWHGADGPGAADQGGGGY